MKTLKMVVVSALGAAVLASLNAATVTSVHIYCSPGGGGDGSGPESPCFLYEAAAKLKGGTSADDLSEIILADGDYDCSGWENDTTKSRDPYSGAGSTRNVFLLNGISNIRIASQSGDPTKVSIIGGGQGSDLRFIAGRTSRTYIEGVTIRNFWTSSEAAVVFKYNETSDPGFLFTNCNIRACGSITGYAVNHWSSCRFVDTRIEECYGSLGTLFGPTMLVNCQLIGNWTTNGYSIGYFLGGENVQGSHFVSNVTYGTTSDGMALFNNSVVFTDCHFWFNRNLSTKASNAILRGASGKTSQNFFDKCTFSNNYAEVNCLFIANARDSVFANNTVNSGNILNTTTLGLTNVTFVGNSSSGSCICKAIPGVSDNVVFRANTAAGCMLDGGSSQGLLNKCKFLCNTNSAVTTANVCVCLDTSSSGKVVYADDCDFIGNVGVNASRGVIGRSVLSNCRIRGNTAQYATWVSSTKGCEIAENTSATHTIYGGTHVNDLVVSNAAASVSGVAGDNGVAVVATNCLFFANRSTGTSAPYVCWGGASVNSTKLINCTLVGNMADSSKGGGLFRLTAYNTIVVGNEPCDLVNIVTLYTCYYGTAASGCGTTFGDEGSIGDLSQNGLLAEWRDKTHPYGCVIRKKHAGGGLTLDFRDDDVDLAGVARMTDGKVDCGCYAYTASPYGLILMVR